MERDTTPEAARIQADVLRRLAPAKRLDIAFEMSETVRSMVRERLHAQHPGLDGPHLRIALIEELYGVRIGTK
ncbi:MAG TPA: hypothetical protein VIM14_04950 [Polyangia bacterium]